MVRRFFTAFEPRFFFGFFFQAPETLSGDALVDPFAADVYALGFLMWQLWYHKVRSLKSNTVGRFSPLLN